MPRLCPDCGQSIRDAIPAEAPCPYCGPIASAGGTLRFNAADYAAVEVPEPISTEPSIHNTIDPRSLPEEEAERWHQTFQQLATPPEALRQTTEIPSGFLPDVESAEDLETHGETVTQEIGDSAQTGSAFRSSTFDLKGSRPTIVTRQLADPEQTPTGDTVGDSFDYELLDVLGRGGMGVVYTARQTSVNREVAVKMIGSGQSQDDGVRAAFLDEAVITGELDHPNIVPIHELGTNRSGTLFYSMKRVTGTPWSRRIAKNSELENLKILSAVADAIAFAHSRGVVHRDLKPENVMLGEYGEVLVMDWGLALVTDAFRKPASVSLSPTPGCTPSYAAPELVTGPMAVIGPHSDVYLLGAILYEIITGKPPHLARSARECCEIAARNGIAPTNKTGELVEIARRAMATDPADRYSSVRDFQQALKGYESHTESLRLTQLANSDLELARVDGKYEDFARGVFGYGQALKLWEENQEAREGLRTARREYAQAALDRQNFELGLGQLDAADPTHQPIITRLQAGLNDRDQRKRRETLLKRGVVALLAVIFFGGTLLTLQIYSGKIAADEAKDKAEAASKVAEEQKTAAEKAETRAVENQKRAETEQANAEAASIKEKESAELARKEKQNAVDAKQVAEDAKQDAIDKSIEAETQRRNAEYEAYVAQVGKAITAIENNDYEIAKTIVETIERKLKTPAVSAEGKFEASPLRPGWELRRLQYLLQQAQTLANFQADGDLNRTTESALSSAKSTLDFEIGAIAVDRSLRRYAIAEQGAQGTIHLGELSLAAETPQSLTLDRIATLGKPVDSLAFSRNQRLLAAGGNEGRIVLWQVGDHGVPTAVEGAPSFDLSIENIANVNVNGVAFIEPTRGSGVGRLWLAAVCSDRGVRLWDLTEFRSGLAARPGPVQNRVKPRVELMGGVQRALAVAPDGTRFVTAGDDGLAVVWSLSPDGTRFQKSESVKSGPATSSASTSETLFSGAFGGHGVPIYSAAFSPDGQSVATGGIDGRILIWDPNRSGAPLVASAVEQRGDALGTLRTLEGHSRAVRSLDYSADGKTLYSASDDRTVCVWNVDPSTPVGPPKVLRGHGDWVRAVRAVNGPAARRFALSGGNDRRLVLWDVEKYSDQGVVLIEDHTITSLRHTDDVLSGMFNSTGTKLLTASRDRSAIVWNLNPQGDANQILDGSPIRLEEGHTDSAVNTRFLPDGKTALTAGLDGRVCLWDLRTGAQVGLLQEPGIAGIVDVSPDGRWIATGGRENGFVLWSVDQALRAFPLRADPANGIQFPQDHGHRSKIRVVAFSPGPRTRLFTGDKEGGGRLWELDGTNLMPPVAIASHSEQINAAVFTPDGERLLTASDDGSIAVHTLGSPKSLRRLELGSPVRYLAIAPDGSRVFAVVEGDSGSGGWQFHEWDLGSEAHTVRPLGSDVTLVFGLTLDLHASPPAVVVPVAVDRQTRLKRLSVGTEFQDRTNETWQELLTNRARKNARKRSSNAVQDPGFSTVWGAAIDATTGRLLTVGDVGADLWQFPPNRAGRQDESTLRVTHQKSLSPHRAVADAAFSLDDQFVATASWDGTFKIWKLDGQSARVWHRVQADRRQPPPPGAGDAPAFPDPAMQMARGAVNSIRFFKNSAGDGGSTVRLITAHQNGDVVVWNWNGTREEEPTEQCFVATQPIREAFCVRAAHAGDQVVILATYAGGTAKLYQYNPERGELRERGEFQGDDAAKHDEKDVLCGAISTDGKWAATGDRDGRIIVWSMETRTPWLKVMRGHSTEITSLAFSESSRSVANSTVGEEDPLTSAGHYDALRLVSGSRDGTAKLWDPRTSFVSTRGNGERLEANDLMTLRLTLDGPASRSEMGGVTAVDISPAGDSIVTVGQLENGSEQKILLWKAMSAKTPGK